MGKHVSSYVILSEDRLHKKLAKPEQLFDTQTIRRFAANIRVVDSGCHIWTGNIGTGDYGFFGIDGKNYKAHRIAWMMTYGRIPEGKSVCHTCDKPPCVNPAHLYLGTAKENAIDRTKHKLRQIEQLEKDEILQIRASFNKGVPHLEIAEKFKLAPAQVHEIAMREDWPWLK